MQGINKYSKEWFALNGNSEYIAKAASLKEGSENLKNTETYTLDGSLFLGDKESVTNNINDYYENSTEETVNIIKNMQAFGAENIFNALDENSDGIVTEEELADMSEASTLQREDTVDTNFSITDLKNFYKNAIAADGAIVEKEDNTIKITYTDGQYTELKTDENGNVYSRYYEKDIDNDRVGVEYNTQDNSKTRTYLDSENRPTKVIYDKKGGTKFDYKTYYTYNDDGSKVVEVETIGKKIITQYDSNGNTISESLELKYNSDGIIDDTKQKDEGNCWALSGVNALRITEKGAEIIKNSIQQNDDGSITVYLNGVNKSYTYQPDDIGYYKKKYNTGDDDMDILMMAIADFRSEKIENGTGTADRENFESYISKKATLEEPLKGGQLDEAIYYLTGINSKFKEKSANKNEKTELLNEYLEADKSDIAATISFSTGDKTVDGGITNAHSYSIIGADDENVYVENPWNAGESIAYPIDKIKENIAQISLTYLNNENKIEEENNEEPETSVQEAEQPADTDKINKKESILEKIGNFFDKIGSGIKSFFKSLF